MHNDRMNVKKKNYEFSDLCFININSSGRTDTKGLTVEE